MPKESHTTEPFEEFCSGLRDEAPLLLGAAPFGMIFGVLGIEAGLSPIAVIALSVILFAGAAQVVFVQMVSVGVAPWVITGTVGLINLRHMLYSATFITYINSLPMRWRIVVAYLLTDEAFFISLQRMQNKPYSPNMYFHLIGSGLLMWTCWQISTIGGIILGALIPPELNLGFAIPLTFMALILPQITSLPPLIAVAVGGSVAVLGQTLPWNIWVILAACCGMGAGYLTEQALGRKGDKR